MLCGILQHSWVKSLWGNECSKWSSVGMLILASLLPEEVMQNCLLSMDGFQGRLLRGKTAHWKGNQGSAAYTAHRCLVEPGLLLSHSSFFTDSLLGERKLVYLGSESSYHRIAIWLCLMGSCCPGIGGRDWDISKGAVWEQHPKIS